jgi:hypothetical protein
MGLLRELFDELIPLPDQAEYHFPEPNLKVSKMNFGYSILNLFFQILDCVLAPYMTYLFLFGKLNFGLFNWFFLIVGISITLFSWIQFIYYFVSPSDNYVNPILGRFFGETAIGLLLASIFRISLTSRIK